MKLYEKLAQHMTDRIEQSYYFAGDKLPSIRELSQAHDVSISTAQETYRLLEHEGWAESRSRSGYYVLKQRKPTLQLPDIRRPPKKPLEVAQWDNVQELVNAFSDPDIVQLGRGSPDIAAVTLRPLIRIQSELRG